MVKLAIAKENWHSPLPVLGPAIAAWPGIVVVTAPASIHAGHDKLSWQVKQSPLETAPSQGTSPADAHSIHDDSFWRGRTIALGT